MLWCSYFLCFGYIVKSFSIETRRSWPKNKVGKLCFSIKTHKNITFSSESTKNSPHELWQKLSAKINFLKVQVELWIKIFGELWPIRRYRLLSINFDNFSNVFRVFSKNRPFASFVCLVLFCDFFVEIGYRIYVPFVQKLPTGSGVKIRWLEIMTDDYTRDVGNNCSILLLSGVFRGTL